MKVFRAILFATVIAFGLSGLALAGSNVPKAPPKVKPGKPAPKQPHVRSTSTKQNTSQGKDSGSGSNYGQKAESKPNPPKK
ncbi:MAG: hypothetical protein HY910_16745 [Desulfarculus sp.]|nr:hypothetical protein [Desulfarculus sp.]